jgi:F-type H+-transporting ATPase subunit delta
MSRAAIRYAKAILDIALTSGKSDAVNNDMISIYQTVSGNEELKSFLQNPVVKIEDKKGAINKIFANVQTETSSLFQLLFANKRFEILSDIANQYTKLNDEHNGVEVAIVTTAFPITSDLEAKVLAKIKEFSNKKITIQNIVDPNIIGGFVLRIGDKQYNASVASKLGELKRQLMN